MEEVNDEFWHAEKLRNFLQINTIILGVRIQTYPKFQEKEVCISMQYVQKNIGLKWFFCLQINTKVFYKVIVFWMCITRLFHSMQDKKFAISVQDIKKNGKNEVDFLLAGKHQRFLQSDTIILGVCIQACPNYPKQQVLYFFAIS